MNKSSLFAFSLLFLNPCYGIDNLEEFQNKNNESSKIEMFSSFPLSPLNPDFLDFTDQKTLGDFFNENNTVLKEDDDNSLDNFDFDIDNFNFSMDENSSYSKLLKEDNKKDLKTTSSKSTWSEDLENVEKRMEKINLPGNIKKVWRLLEHTIHKLRFVDNDELFLTLYDNDFGEDPIENKEVEKDLKDAAECLRKELVDFIVSQKEYNSEKEKQSAKDSITESLTRNLTYLFENIGDIPFSKSLEKLRTYLHPNPEDDAFGTCNKLLEEIYQELYPFSKTSLRKTNITDEMANAICEKYKESYTLGYDGLYRRLRKIKLESESLKMICKKAKSLCKKKDLEKNSQKIVLTSHLKKIMDSLIEKSETEKDPTNLAKALCINLNIEPQTLANSLRGNIITYKSIVDVIKHEGLIRAVGNAAYILHKEGNKTKEDLTYTLKKTTDSLIKKSETEKDPTNLAKALYGELDVSSDTLKKRLEIILTYKGNKDVTENEKLIRQVFNAAARLTIEENGTKETLTSGLKEIIDPLIKKSETEKDPTNLAKALRSELNITSGTLASRLEKILSYKSIKDVIENEKLIRQVFNAAMVLIKKENGTKETLTPTLKKTIDLLIEKSGMEKDPTTLAKALRNELKIKDGALCGRLERIRTYKGIESVTKHDELIRRVYNAVKGLAKKEPSANKKRKKLVDKETTTSSKKKKN